MDNRYLKKIENLDSQDLMIRLGSLQALADGIAQGDIPGSQQSNNVNNHIHTFYSFSPYSPAKAVWMAYQAGLTALGIMDHDTVGGVLEFIKSGMIMGLATTIGVECRVDFSNTALGGRRINNPDQKSVAYMAIHGIPHTQIDRIGEFFIPYASERNKRNIRMTDRINDLMIPFGVTLDFERDVKPLSKWKEGGSITERHILFALSHKLTERFGKGPALVNFLHSKLDIDISMKAGERLLDDKNQFYDYDLLGVLKSSLLERIYIDAKAECPDVRDVMTLCEETGSIAAYAYLGDVEDSITGDKKTQKFEDGYLEELFETIKSLGFHAVTYMPSRNTRQQLDKVRSLCDRHGLFQISGEDINSPRQSFTSKTMESPEFANLVDSTWALVGHEKAATQDLCKGMFSKTTIREYPDLKDRIHVFKIIGANAADNAETYFHTL